MAQFKAVRRSLQNSKIESRSSFLTTGTAFIVTLLCLLLTGCNNRDAEMRAKITGNWPVRPSGSMTFLPDGSFHFTNSFVSSNGTLKWSSDGTWDVKDGFLITTMTNSTAENTTEKPAAGVAHQYKINLIDDHHFSYGTESEGSSYER